MKKRIKQLFRSCVACTAILLVHPCVHAQVSNPSQWQEFVQSSGNTLLCDTFRMQTFAEKSTDNWRYTTAENASVQNTSLVESPGKHGEQGLQMPMNSKAVFEPYSLNHYQDVSIYVHQAGQHLVPGEEITVRTYREGETSYPKLLRISKNDQTVPFSKTEIGRTPKGLDIIIPKPASNTLNGCYFVDSVYAKGYIPTYSLFTGNGNWNDTLCWSHFPAERHRKALLKGNVTVRSEVHCNEIAIGEGSLKIDTFGELYTNLVTIHSNDQQPQITGGLQSSGLLHVQDKLVVQKTFAEKGKWYFISFPFDVYASGIDPNFQLSDDQHPTNGNYFYVQAYNGDKRSSSQNAINNWDVLSANLSETNQPIFQKNKGYLIALDASASTHTLSFSSQSNDLPTDFGKNGEISIQVSSLNQENTDHVGWFLCGNPFPYPLSLSQLQSNNNLDGYVYIYEGNEYKAYALGSDYLIPPFSAFFVKAKQSTRIIVQQSSELRGTYLLPTNQSLKSTLSEPKTHSANVTSNQVNNDMTFHFRLEKRSFIVQNLPASSILKIYTPSGKLVWENVVPQGTSVHSLQIPQGIYILLIQTGEKIIHEKIVLES